MNEIPVSGFGIPESRTNIPRRCDKLVDTPQLGAPPLKLAALRNPEFVEQMRSRSHELFGNRSRLAVILAVWHSTDLVTRADLARQARVSESLVLEATNFLESISAVMRVQPERNLYFAAVKGPFWDWMAQVFSSFDHRTTRTSRNRHTSPDIDAPQTTI